MALGSRLRLLGREKFESTGIVRERNVGVEQRHTQRLRRSADRSAVDVIEAADRMQMWLYDLARDTFSRFTFCGFCGLVAAVAVAVGGAVTAAVGAASGAAVTGAAVDAGAGAAAVFVAVENFVPRSNRFFC